MLVRPGGDRSARALSAQRDVGARDAAPRRASTAAELLARRARTCSALARRPRAPARRSSRDDRRLTPTGRAQALALAGDRRRRVEQPSRQLVDRVRRRCGESPRAAPRSACGEPPAGRAAGEPMSLVEGTAETSLGAPVGGLDRHAQALARCDAGGARRPCDCRSSAHGRRPRTATSGPGTHDRLRAVSFSGAEAIPAGPPPRRSAMPPGRPTGPSGASARARCRGPRRWS